MSCTCNGFNRFQHLRDLTESPVQSQNALLTKVSELQAELARIIRGIGDNPCRFHSRPGRTLITFEDFKSYLLEITEELEISAFYGPDDPRLIELARNAADRVARGPSLPLSSSQEVANLAALGLYDNIFFLDDSGSMATGTRIPDMQLLFNRVITITGHLTNDGVSVRFMNFPGDSGFNGLTDPGDAASIWKLVPFTGPTPLGTQLRAKVVRPMILDRARKLEKPVLVTIITDGEPNAEPEDALYQTMRYTMDQMVAMEMGNRHVRFQISQVGDSAAARAFIEGLHNQTTIRRILHITSGSVDPGLALFRQRENELQTWVLSLMVGMIP